MKKISVVLICMLLVLSCVFAGGDKENKNAKTSDAVTVISDSAEKTSESSESESLTKTVALVNLIKQTAITEEQVNATLEAYKDYGISREDVVNSLIEDELLRQGVERDGYSEYFDYYKKMYLEQYRTYVENQIGQKLSDEEFEKICYLYNGASSEEIAQSYSENMVLRRYVQVVKEDLFENAAFPTDEEISSFYSKNVSSFVSAENVKLSHIFFEFGENKEDSLKKAEDISSKIQKGTLTFEKAVTEYSEDASSKDNGGDIGYLSLDDESSTKSMGDNFVKEVFKLEVGKSSKVIESSVGYHIVKVSEHNQSRILALDDKLSEDQNVTVADYIENYLTELLYEDLISQAYKEVVAELKEEASIKYIG